MGKKWFVVYTRPHQEIKISEQLNAMGITNYCPTITLMKQYSDRKKKVIRPLISSYIMVFLEESSRNLVFSCIGIVRYLFFQGKPAVVSTSDIDQMKDHLNGIYRGFNIAALSVGEYHKITEGPFSGKSGKVVQTDNKKVKLELVSLGMCIILKKQVA